MAIPYSLFKNNLTPDPTDYAAVVQTHRSVGFPELADRMVSQGSTVTRPDILAVLDDAEAVCEQFLLEGNRVVLGGLVQLFPRVRGVFASATDSFDGARHQLDVGANPGRRVRKTVRDSGKVEKLQSNKPTPELLEFVDVATGELNALMTPGNIANLSGSNLKVQVGQPDEGIFLVPATGGPAVRVDILSRNEPSALSFLIPPLPVGEYGLEVRARIGGGQVVRVGRLEQTLTVPEGLGIG